MPSDDTGAGPDPLDRLVEAVLASPKYRTVSETLARRIGAEELAKRRPFKEAVKATKNKLHQVAGAYLESPAYGAWLEELRAGFAAGEEQARAALLRVMGRHASTRERLPILADFYRQTLGGLEPARKVIDLACGLNPLAIPWMPLAEGADYLACDIYTDLTAFLDQTFALMSGYPWARGRAETRDILSTPPDEPADLALLLKAIPCLEQVDKDAGVRLLGAIRAERLLVSYPLRTLGGRAVGMQAHYEERFHDLLRRVGGSAWRVTRHAFPTELAFLIER